MLIGDDRFLSRDKDTIQWKQRVTVLTAHWAHVACDTGRLTDALSRSCERSLGFAAQLMLAPHETPLLSIEVWKCESLSRVWLFVTPWTVAHQAPLSVGFSRQEYWSGQPFPSLGHLPNQGIKPGSPTLQVDSFPSGPPGKPIKNTLILPVRLCSSSQNSENINHQEETWPTERKLRHSSCRAVRQRCRGRTRGKAASLQAGRAAWMSPAAPLPTPSASVSLRCSPLKWKCIGERFWGRWFSQTKLTHYKATTGEGKGYPLQCPGLENSRDDAWVTESTRLSDFHCQYH